MDSFYSQPELNRINFKSIGSNVLISKFARFYEPDKIEIGNNVRIDDFCILSGNIKLGSYIHISAYTALYGKFGIELENYSGLSPRCTIFSASDDFSGDYLIGPMVDSRFTNIIGGKVIIKRYCQLGSNCVVLPNLIINEGAVVGAMSLINRSLDAWKVFKGIPATYYKERSRDLLKLDFFGK
jgi:acetyltransferase-like isoleucine patch superfamily enzyme